MRWFPVQLRPNGLERARCNLLRQGFSLFCPMEPKMLKRKGGLGLFWRELFPGYLFVGFDPATAPWSKINNTFGVARLIVFGKTRPQAVPEALIDGLIERCDAEGHLLPPKRLSAGDKVRIVSGPFFDFAATIERVTPDQRIWVLLDLMGRKTPIALERKHLQPV
ncbi:MAG: transcriptional activator RfaH [Alphaproteobacteria bacterium]|nr:transcriptional activator RfaH [Alphaproteobacteria bacterium]